MTVIFIHQRFDLNKGWWNLSKRTLMIIIFVFSLMGQFLFRFLGQGSEIWLVVYCFTITVLVIGDKIAKRNANRILDKDN